MNVPQIMVIGTASLDVLHLGDDTSHHTVGGAGLYTALASYKAGASTGLYAPRPNPMPVPLQPVAQRLSWTGPSIPPEALPRLEIAHLGEGCATLIDASWGAESQLNPAHLRAEVHQAAFVHVAALPTAERQLEFVQTLAAARGERKRPVISVGTYARLVYGETAGVRDLWAQADLFFMNENEARGLFGSVEQARTRPDALLFVTLDAQGVLVIRGDDVTHIPAQVVPEVDPTGAGDTFCGATLAGLARGMSPVAAAAQAVVLAARTVGAVGPMALL